jgi:RNA polymerase sigma factor (sigma-70 family)
MDQSTRAPTDVGASRVAEQLAAHEGLVRWVVRRQWRGALSAADALHAGRLGLWQALAHYDPGRGTRFSSYAVPAIRHAVWRAVAERRPAVPPPTEAAAAREGAWVDPDEALAAAEVRVALDELLERLAPRLRRVVVAHYGLEGGSPQSFAAIGRMLGCTRQRAQQLHATALGWLAQPAHSRALRRLLGRDRRADYRQALARQRRRARARHRARRGRPWA